MGDKSDVGFRVEEHYTQTNLQVSSNIPALFKTKERADCFTRQNPSGFPENQRG